MKFLVACSFCAALFAGWVALGVYFVRSADTLPTYALVALAFYLFTAPVRVVFQLLAGGS